MNTIEKLKQIKIEVLHSVDDIMNTDLSADQLANLISAKIDVLLEIDNLISVVNRINNK